MNSSSYFIKHSLQFDPFGKSGSSSMRRCQLGAYWATWSHFSASAEPALLSLPTGAGKTGVMMALSFGLAARRVLIVTPARLLRDQLAGQFRDLKLLRSLGALKAGTPNPRVYSNDSKLRTKEAWHTLTDYDVVTATPVTTSPEQSGVCVPPPDLFDLVFLDEAHHAPAKTWDAILRSFRGSRCVLLTATPFRSDKRGLGARLVYHYPIVRALEDGIYRPVQYHPVTAPPSRAARDNALSESAKKILLKERHSGHEPKILVRAADIAWSNRLVEVYQRHGLRLGAVDYDKPAAENHATIDAVRQGLLDGMVCVGMLGEGLDLPALKIAVLHAAPRSLPFTLQFVGRVSRTTSGDPGDAHLLSVPEEVTGEMRRLHHRNDADWRLLIPKLAEEVLGKVTDYSPLYSSSSLDDIRVNLGNLKPFFSVRVYRVGGQEFRLFRNTLEPPEESEIALLDNDTLDGGVVVITERDEVPPWAQSTQIRQRVYDLHVFIKRDDFLFESTSWDRGANHLRHQLFSDADEPLAPAVLMRAMHVSTTVTYFNIGLRNAAGNGRAQPAYKSLAGTEVQAAVRPTEGRIFAPGHALAKVSNDETRGVATATSRIWATKRGDIHHFADWCEALATVLVKQPQTAGLPQLGFLASSLTLTKLPGRPLVGMLDERLLAGRVIVRPLQPIEAPEGDLRPYIEIRTLRQGVLRCELQFDMERPPIHLSYDPSRTPCWQQEDERDFYVAIEFPSRSPFVGDIASFLAEYPPRLIMPAGGTVINKDHWLPTYRQAQLPSGVLIAKEWPGCDITSEQGSVAKGQKNIHDWLQSQLVKATSQHTVIVKDHGKGEIADFIVIDPSSTTREITFYHCKGATGTRNSDRIKDVEEVLSQACRSAQWLNQGALLTMIRNQTLPKRRSPILKGTSEQLLQLAHGFESNMWTHRVVVVQPGLLCEVGEGSEKTGFLLATTYELMARNNVVFEFWGS